MSKLTDKISYLKGLAEGLKLDPENIDEDLADLEADLYDEDDEDLADDEDEEDDEDAEAGGALLYECPHCHQEVELDPDELDLEEDHPCPNCGGELFPELPEEV